MIELVLEDASLSVADEFAIARLLNRKRKAQHAQRRERHRRSHVAKGLCVKCSRAAKPGRRHCAHCIHKGTARTRGIRAAMFGWKG